jgi:hypothetical protein
MPEASAALTPVEGAAAVVAEVTDTVNSKILLSINFFPRVAR